MLLSDAFGLDDVVLQRPQGIISSPPIAAISLELGRFFSESPCCSILWVSVLLLQPRQMSWSAPAPHFMDSHGPDPAHAH